VKLSLQWLHSSQLLDYQKEFQEIEKEFLYPLGTHDFFWISHGSAYSAFFERMGATHFLMATHSNRELVGWLALIEKEIQRDSQTERVLYLADLKIRKKYQGHAFSRFFYKETFKRLAKDYYQKGWSFCYFVGMEGKKGNVSRTFRGSLFSCLSQRWTSLKIFMVPPQPLASLLVRPCLEEGEEGISLSSLPIRCPSKRATSLPLFSTLEGLKDLYLDSTQKSWKLAHIDLNQARGIGVLQRLRLAGEELLQSTPEVSACFALDVRRFRLIEALKEQKIDTSIEAFLGGFSFQPSRFSHRFFMLNTDEI
jgi:hypothetical protein